jgi:hypothetical protein
MFVMSDPVAVSRKLIAVFAADVEGYNRIERGSRSEVCPMPPR